MASRAGLGFLLRAGGAAAGAAAFGAAFVLHNDRQRFRLFAQQQQPHPHFHPERLLDPHRMRMPRSKWDDDWDGRNYQWAPPTIQEVENSSKDNSSTDNSSNSADKCPKASRHLILIRHGHYNLSGKTDEERKLTDLGRMQATETGRRLRSQDVAWTRIVRSDMTRAVETADLIVNELGGEDKVRDLIESPDPMLREGAPVRPEPDVGTWKPEHGYHQDGSRIEAAFRKYFHRADPEQDRDSYEMIVCHANVIRYFVCRALQLPPEAWLRFSLRHASVTWVTIRPSGKVFVQNLGDSGHLPADMLTTTHPHTSLFIPKERRSG